MIRRTIILVPLIWLTASRLYAQEQKSLLQLAEAAYARQEYATAGAIYNRIARNKGDKMPVDQWMKMARSYQEIGYYKEASDAYQRIIQRPDRPAAAYFAYGEVLRQLQQYDAAKAQYALFATSKADSLQLKAIALISCDSAAVWSRQGAPVQLKRLGELNTAGSDVVSGVVQQGLLLMSNGYRSLALNSGSQANPPIDKRTEQPYFKAYVYRQQAGNNGNAYLEELVPGLLGKYHYNIGPVCMNRTEDTLYATINIQGKDVPYTGKGPVNGVRHLQLYQSVKKNGKWETPVLIPGINMEGYSSSHAVLSTGGDILYFVSDRPGGQGQTDIWYAEKQADGSWGTPVNCGDRINTVAAETFPTINEDGMLYFSSKGHAGMGGYDIYRVKGTKAGWDTPENMKLPYNSGADDIGLVLKRDGNEGYLASNRQGGQGRDDVYYFSGPDHFSRNGQPLSPPPATGHGEPPATEQLPPQLVKRHTAEELADKKKLESLKFLYDYNSANLLADSRRILDDVAAVLKRHPDWKVVITSFADSRGSDQYNIDLSALRCFAVIDYLSHKGISPTHLYYSNRGENDPVNGCKDGVPCKEEDYRQNRRSELRVKW
ncbi:OmpA family protein [Chitinophaga qingshengii]|uniref:OmpA family protein n=1 Tax=Chitinophaga qingshengii TaxID=1569794 RepID=A0ABR7TSW9_9BACT|nr:OmpA family protein [Chitinophaga qingshengii]MBC9932755.1 OmpA family protein [Chitinophaga qingshengii]